MSQFFQGTRCLFGAVFKVPSSSMILWIGQRGLRYTQLFVLALNRLGSRSRVVLASEGRGSEAQSNELQGTMHGEV